MGSIEHAICVNGAFLSIAALMAFDNVRRSSGEIRWLFPIFVLSLATFHFAGVASNFGLLG